MSLIRLRRIALFTQHLQVVVGGMPAFASRNDACLLGYIPLLIVSSKKQNPQCRNIGSFKINHLSSKLPVTHRGWSHSGISLPSLSAAESSHSYNKEPARHCRYIRCTCPYPAAFVPKNPCHRCHRGKSAAHPDTQ